MARVGDESILLAAVQLQRVTGEPIKTAGVRIVFNRPMELACITGRTVLWWACAYEEITLSRAFVREQDDADIFEDLPDRSISPFRNLVTSRGLKRMDAEISTLRSAYAKAVAAQDKAATAKVSRDLRYWTSRRASAELVEPTQISGSVRFGMTVTIQREDGKRQTFRIVGEDEADPKSGRLSHASPLARALLGKEVGDVISTAQGEVEIVQITLAEPE